MVTVECTDEFGARLSLALQACNLSRAQLSSELGVHKSMVSRWLSGEMKPSGYNLARLSAAIAGLKPGFNMSLWAAPRTEFEAVLGLSSASAALPAQAQSSDAVSKSSHWPSTAHRIFSRRSGRYLAIGAVLLALVLAVGAALLRAPELSPWQSNPKSMAPAKASVAVMPFVNMSGDPTKEYLGDGISEEILNDLANTANLRVAARTSSFSFKGKRADIAEVARKLHVRAVLEGSIRQEGDRIRIIAQLIDAGDGFHIWSARYDRKLDDILAVQDEIAGAIAAALAPRLVPGRGPSVHRAPPRIDPDAYTAYLKGRYAMNRANAEDFLRAAELFRQAVRLQPDFAAARASLGLAYVVLYSNGERRDTLGPAKEQIAATLRLDPGNFTAQLANAQLKALAWKWGDAVAAMQKSIAQHPNEPDAHFFYAALLQNLGLWDKSLRELRRAADLDPLVPAYRENIGVTLHVLGLDAQAAGEYRRVLALDPDFFWAFADLCPNYADTGRLDEAHQILSQRLMPKYAADRSTLYCAAVIAYRENNRAQLENIARTMERLYARNALGASWIPFPYAFLGDYERAMDWLEKAYDQHDYNLFYTIAESDLPAPLKQTLRWRTFMQRPAFREIAQVRAQVLARDSSAR